MELQTLLSTAMVSEILLPVTAAMATTTALSAILIWYTHPGATLSFLQNVGVYLLGMRLRSVEVQGIRVCYAEKGRRTPGVPSMLFIHGFSATKEMWLTLIPRLPGDLHLVLVDLPGHGDTDLPTDDMDLTAPGAAKFVHEFAEAISLTREPFHIVGLSMGGAVAAVYAGMYPHQVALATICCPAILGPVDTDFVKDCRLGRFCLVPDTVEDIRDMMLKCCYAKHRVPANKQLLTAFLEMRRHRHDFYWNLFNVLFKSMDALSEEILDYASKIEAPTQVMWGRHDELLHVTCADVLRKRLKNCARMDILDKCGHIPSFDRPGAMTKALLEFRGELNKRKRFMFI